ncbi:MAG: M24 family metallopeptidase, partial [Aquabacterium sp.]|nr:M24 family metallopeptidase [Aquabacterium sp.]
MKDHDAFCRILSRYTRTYFDFAVNHEVSEYVRDIQKEKRLKFYKGATRVMQSIRCVKSESELRLLSRSSQIASLSMMAAMQFCQVGMIESELAVWFEANCKMRGAKQLSFECSVASGANAANLAYFQNASLLRAGSLCLIDCGCEFSGYASDITRTFPVSGKFSEEQRSLYELVLDVQTKLIAAMRPKTGSIKKLETKTRRLLKRGLDELGITRNLTKQQLASLKLMSSDVHYVAHFVGLDIHDTSEIAMGRPFEPGMVLAIEPAVYLPDHPLIPPKFRSIGIRIEDNVEITRGGARILSSALPRTCQQVEAVMAEKSKFS